MEEEVKPLWQGEIPVMYGMNYEQLLARATAVETKDGVDLTLKMSREQSDLILDFLMNKIPMAMSWTWTPNPGFPTKGAR